MYESFERPGHGYWYMVGAIDATNNVHRGALIPGEVIGVSVDPTSYPTGVTFVYDGADALVAVYNDINVGHINFGGVYGNVYDASINSRTGYIIIDGISTSDPTFSVGKTNLFYQFVNQTTDESWMTYINIGESMGQNIILHSEISYEDWVPNDPQYQQDYRDGYREGAWFDMMLNRDAM